MIENTPEAWSARAQLDASWEATRWSQEGQQERFSAVLTALQPRPGESLLDYGCGTGALSERLHDTVLYTGYDWSAGMIERARREHRRGAFETVRPRKPFDLVAVVGTFNLQHEWSKELTAATLRMLWLNHRPRALAASLYAGDDPDCIRYRPEDLADFAVLTDAWWTISHYRANDLLLVLYSNT